MSGGMADSDPKNKLTGETKVITLLFDKVNSDEKGIVTEEKCQWNRGF